MFKISERVFKHFAQNVIKTNVNSMSKCMLLRKKVKKHFKVVIKRRKFNDWCYRI